MLGWRWYHAPTRSRIMMATSANPENHAMLRCPAGSTINAATGCGTIDCLGEELANDPNRQRRLLA
jgi:hypothetical protein